MLASLVVLILAFVGICVGSVVVLLIAKACGYNPNKVAASKKAKSNDDPPPSIFG